VKVVDASAFIEVLARTEKASVIEGLLDDELFAPDLLVTEVMHYVRFELLGGRLTARQADATLDVLMHADIEYLHVWPLTARMWQLRRNVSAYDACYVAMAESLDAPLLTTDARLGGVPGLHAQLIVV
jgi:predicted nucleic acid-binding protein